nr:MmcQ/YjbR family DNA-binding protein [Ligilactobacillus salivarius]
MREVELVERKELFAYVAEHHQVNPEYLWKKNPNYAVLRHHHNRKWYAIVMDVEAEKLGLKGTQLEEIINLKLEPELIEILQQSEGYLPAYHMNKQHWISVQLKKVAPEQILKLLEMSYKFTK